MAQQLHSRESASSPSAEPLYAIRRALNISTLTLVFAILVNTNCVFSQPYIDSIKVFPIDPTSLDSIMIITSVTTPYTGLYVGHEMIQNGTTISIDICVVEGFLAAFETYIDTFELAPLSEGMYTINVETHYSGEMESCVPLDTRTASFSFGVDLASITNGKLIKRIFDLIGRETNDKPNTPLIYVYEDGTIERVFRVE